MKGTTYLEVNSKGNKLYAFCFAKKISTKCGRVALGLQPTSIRRCYMKSNFKRVDKANREMVPDELEYTLFGQ